jgi:hypothetical protein
MRDPKGMLLDPQQRARRAGQLFATGLALALIERGGKLHAEPGVFFLRGPNCDFNPFDSRDGLMARKLSAGEWVVRCCTLGIADLPLAPASTQQMTCRGWRPRLRSGQLRFFDRKSGGEDPEWGGAALTFRVHSVAALVPMPAITAILHTENDALRLGRALETLYPCDDILVVDHSSRDTTAEVARAYGARVVEISSGESSRHYLEAVIPGWLLCLGPRESLSEKLAATLYDWKSKSVASGEVFSLFLREETAEGWIEHPRPQTRLVPRDWKHWQGQFPAHDESAITLEGELLRFTFP